MSARSQTTFRENAAGAALMAASMACFTINDTFMKSLSSDWPFFQALFVRSIGSVVVLGVFAAMRGFRWGGFTRSDWQLVVLRTIAEVGAAYFFISALFHMPIATITAIIQALPLTVALAGALFLGESIGWRRLVAIALGGLGMLLIVRPGTEGFDRYALFGVLAVVCVTARDLCARRLGRGVPTTTVAFVTVMAIALFAGTGAALTEWAPITTTALAKVGGATVFVIGGYIFSIQVMRQGDIAFVAPFRYTSLLWALLLGWAVFANLPDALTLVGAAVIVGTGLFAFWRERLAARGSG